LTYSSSLAVQAREVAEELSIFDEVGLFGAFVFTFVQPAIEDSVIMKMLEDLKIDPDIASYSLVKSYADKYGSTYPDMQWEPKESFRAVVEYYSNH
jgi:hypothetical protein